MQNKKLIIITTLLAAVSALAVFYIQKETFEETPNISDFGKKDAYSLSEEYLQEQGINLTGYEFAYSIYSDNTLEAFLNENFKKDEITKIFKNDNISRLIYSTRFFKNLEKEEYKVSINPVSKKVIGFSKIVKETHEEKAVSKKDAENVSISFLEKVGYDLTQLENYDYVEQKFPNRVEHLFTFKIADTEKVSDYGKFFKKVSISSSGGNIYSFGETYFIPKEFKMKITHEQSYWKSFAMLSLLISVLMIILAFVVFFKKVRQKNIQWKLFLGISTILFIFIVIDFFNGINLIKFTYLTNLSLTMSLITAGIFTIITALVMVGIIYVTGSAGDHYYKKENGENNNFLGNIKTATASRETSISICVGYMLAFILTGVTSLIYYIGEIYFGVWSYGDTNVIFLFTSSIPAFSVFIVIALFPAIAEELLYRLFSIRFFENVTKSLLLGIVISSLIWAVTHMTDTAFPFYFKGIELLIVGGLLGFYFSKFGIIATITAHYVYNSLLALMISYFIVDTFNFYLIFVVMIIPAILSIFGFCNNKKQT